MIAQMIGNDIPALVRTARELQQYPVAAVDLNLGCPVPIVYRKCAGGGLLREPERIDGILGALREAVAIPFTVKTRIGFDDPAVFEELLPIFARHSLDLLTVHGRTVKEMYRSAPHYEFIARAVDAMPCPVLANGNIYSADKAAEVLALTGARGLMIGRGAIRNPWLFHQIREHAAASPSFARADVTCWNTSTRSTKRSARPGCASVAGPEDEEVHELHRPRRGAERPVPARNPPRHHASGFFRVCRVPRSRRADAAGAFPDRVEKTDVMAGECP